MFVCSTGFSRASRSNGSPVPWLRVVNTSSFVLPDMANDIQYEERETSLSDIKGLFGKE
jgi:hypothetical protein